MPFDGMTGTTVRGRHGDGRDLPYNARRWTSRDLNHLLYRQQVERTRAEAAASPAARHAHCELARLFEEAVEHVTGGRIRFAALTA